VQQLFPPREREFTAGPAVKRAESGAYRQSGQNSEQGIAVHTGKFAWTGQGRFDGVRMRQRGRLSINAQATAANRNTAMKTG
jgi:hypothetical protein